jgi:hypothetical protein
MKTEQHFIQHITMSDCLREQTAILRCYLLLKMNGSFMHTVCKLLGHSHMTKRSLHCTRNPVTSCEDWVWCAMFQHYNMWQVSFTEPINCKQCTTHYFFSHITEEETATAGWQLTPSERVQPSHTVLHSYRSKLTVLTSKSVLTISSYDNTTHFPPWWDADTWQTHNSIFFLVICQPNAKAIIAVPLASKSFHMLIIFVTFYKIHLG